MPPDLIDDEIIVEIPGDEIALGHDADGLPKTVLVEKPKFEAKAELEDKEVKPSKEEADLLKALKDEKEQMARERDEARQARETALADAEARIKTEREAREAAEAAAEKSTGDASNAHWATLHARKEQFEAGAANTRDQIAAIKRDIAKASEDGEHARLGDLNEQLAEAVANRQTYEQATAEVAKEIKKTSDYFAAMKEAKPEKKEPEAKKEEKAPEQPKAKTPEEWIAAFPRKTQAWLKANKDYVTDPAKHKQLTDFAAEWTADYGAATLHTPAFIEALNKQFAPEPEEVDVAEKEEKEAVADVKPVKAKTKVTASAPVSRSGDYFSSQNVNAAKVKLPPKLAAFVKASGLDATQYALGAVADIKAGKLPKDFLDPDYDHQF